MAKKNENPTRICVVTTPAMAALGSLIGKGEPYSLSRLPLEGIKGTREHMRSLRYFPLVDIIIFCVGSTPVERRIGTIALKELQAALAELDGAKPFLAVFPAAGRGCSRYASGANYFQPVKVVEDQLLSIASKMWTETKFKYGHQLVSEQKLPIVFDPKPPPPVDPNDFPSFLERLKGYGRESLAQTRKVCEAIKPQDTELVATD